MILCFFVAANFLVSAAASAAGRSNELVSPCEGLIFNMKKEWDGSGKFEVGKIPATSEQIMRRIFQSAGYLSGYVCFAFFTKSFLDVTEERGVSTSDLFMYVQHTGFLHSSRRYLLSFVHLK